MALAASIHDWSAFAPGLETRGQWQAWAASPWLPEGDAVPALAAMPAMQRRRVEKLGRMALQVAWDCQPDADPALPLVFSSRHGDIARTFEMLSGLARDEPLSPTHFGLSTHNAIAAQYSIARALTGNYLAISGGIESAEAGLAEAVALIADGAPEVLLVVYDGPTPAAYARYQDEPECAWAWAWAWRLGPVRADRPTLALESLPPAASPDAAAHLDTPAGARDAGPPSASAALPHGLDLLRFFLAGDPSLACPGSARRWTRLG